MQYQIAFLSIFLLDEYDKKNPVEVFMCVVLLQYIMLHKHWINLSKSFKEVDLG